MKTHGIRGALGILMLLTAPAAAEVTFTTAREAETEGRWSEAREAWKTLAASGDLRSREGYLRLLDTLGDHETLDREAQSAAEAHPEWDLPAVFRARALGARGKPGEGAEILAPLAGTSLAAAAERARLLEITGDRTAARALMEDLNKTFRARKNPSPRERYYGALAAASLGNFEGASRLLQTAIADSAGFLEARLELASLFREKYQANLAGDELNEAHRLYPEHPDVHLTWAWMAYQGTRLHQAEVEAKKVLEIRPTDPDARVLLGTLALIADQTEVARNYAEEALAVDPLNREARALLAGAHYLAGDTEAFERESAKILEQDPGYNQVYLDLARVLEINRRNEEAMALYQRVLERVPEHPDALIDKGLLLMREGQEKEARGFLEKGFAGDPFNIRAYNQLELLDELETYDHYQSEHFDIHLKAEEDSLLVPILIRDLEEIYKDLVPLHQWEPKKRTIVEVFPSHDWFSARVTGYPQVPGIPAVCFGDVIATDSPRTLAGASNWRDILRHEFGHVLALGMTDKKVPFWFTEGLSVFLEKYPRGERWDANLKAAWVDNNLVPLDSLTIAFTRPRNHGQRMLAYHEAGLIVEDIVNTHGWEAIPKLLRSFGEGTTFDDALKKVLGTDRNRFERHVGELIEAHAAALPVWPVPSKERMERLTAAVEAGSRDKDLLELLVLTQTQFHLAEETTLTAKKLLEIEPDNIRAAMALGIMALTQKQTAQARIRLEEAAAGGSRDIPVYLGLASLYVEAADTARALESYDRALEIYPLSLDALQRKADLLMAQGRRGEARDTFRTLLVSDATSPLAALELARLEIEEERSEGALEALEYARGVLAVHPDLEALLGRTYLLLGRDREAYDLFLKARKLDMRNVEAMVGMSNFYLKSGDVEEAVYFAQLALKYDPEHPGARDALLRATAD